MKKADPPRLRPSACLLLACEGTEARDSPTCVMLMCAGWVGTPRACPLCQLMTWRLSGFSSAAHAASQVRAAAAARVPPAASSADTPIPVCIYCSAFAPLYFSLTTLDCPAPLRCYRGLLYSFTLQRLSTGAAQTNPCSMFVLCTAILLWNKTKHSVALQAEACCYSAAGPAQCARPKL